MLAGLGPIYAKLVASGSVDERTALMLFLLIEKLQGEVRQPYRSYCIMAYTPGFLSVPTHAVQSRRISQHPSMCSVGAAAVALAEFATLNT